MAQVTTQPGEEQPIPTTRPWWGYSVAVAAVSLAVLLRWAVLRTVTDLPLYLTFYPAVFAAAVVGGTGPGLLATLLSTLAAVVLFIEPVGTFELTTAGQAVAVGLFVAVNLAISILGGRFRLKSQALRENQARMRLAHQAAHIGTFEWNLRTGVNSWTPDLEVMYGLKPGEFGRTERAWEQLVHPEDRTRAVATVNRALETFEPQEGEWRVVWPDGTVHWLVGRFQAFRGRAGKAQRLVGVNIDVTNRKQAQEVVRESEERFRTMADAMPQLAWVARADGYIFWFNRRCFEYTGARLEQPQPATAQGGY